MTEPVASIKQKSVHEELAHHLKAMLLPTNADQLVIGKFMKHSWFFFEVIIKSMAQHLLSTGRIKVRKRLLPVVGEGGAGVCGTFPLLGGLVCLISYYSH